MVNTYEAILLTLLFAILAIQVSIALTVLPYVRLGRRLRIRMDEYVDALLLSEDATTLAQEQTHGVPPEKKQGLEHKRERLAALAIGGQARQYLGRSLTADSIDAMAQEDIERLYTRYEARLGAMMTKTLGQAAIQLYASVVGSVLPIPPQNQSLLAKELEEDPFIGHAVSSAACGLYHHFGSYLAPLTAMLTTAKHCRFGEGAQPRHTHKQHQNGGNPTLGNDPSDSRGAPALGNDPSDSRGAPAPYPDGSFDEVDAHEGP